MLRHGGATPGYTSQNYVFPEDNAAVVVFVNQDATAATGTIGSQFSKLLLGIENDTSSQNLQRDRRVYYPQRGRIDRAVFTSDACTYFTSERWPTTTQASAPWARFNSSPEPIKDSVVEWPFARTESLSLRNP